MDTVLVSREKIDDNSWNTVVLSLAISGGTIISDDNMAEIRIYTPKMNENTLILEKVFLSYWIETSKLNELYDAICEQQDELDLHNSDVREQEKIREERDMAILSSKKVKRRGKLLANQSKPIDDYET